jgi:MoaA/NifB/PqqE/SkfB family radical SAM enzyme
VQLEGGEPTVHPGFWAFVAAARAHHGCRRLVLCTNGVALPRTRDRLGPYLERLGAPLTIKLSINHHLLERDPGLLSLAAALRELCTPPERLLVLNVRLRRGVEGDDRAVRDAVRAAGLEALANVFFLQRYGFAKDELSWDEPFVVGTRFTLINPDGQAFGPELVARSEAMGRLP